MACCDSCAKGQPCESKNEQSKGAQAIQVINASLDKKSKFSKQGSKFTHGSSSQWRFGFTYPLSEEAPKQEGVLKEPSAEGTSAPDLYLIKGSTGTQGLGSPAASELSFPRAPREVSMERRQMSQQVTTGGDRLH
jgi:hypothetical protein